MFERVVKIALAGVFHAGPTSANRTTVSIYESGGKALRNRVQGAYFVREFCQYLRLLHVHIRNVVLLGEQAGSHFSIAGFSVHISHGLFLGIRASATLAPCPSSSCSSCSSSILRRRGRR